jgi:phosphoglucosamine mutase
MPRIEFGSDGIRGITGQWPLLPPIVFHIGQALGLFARQAGHAVAVIGRDTRADGVKLLNCLAAGLMDQGVDVIDLELITTPGVAFVTRQQGAQLGVIISASHSSFEFNGIKVVNQDSLRLQRAQEADVESLIERCLTQPFPPAEPLGQETDAQTLVESYIQDHVQHSPAPSLAEMKLVLDCADGAASGIAPEIFRRLGAEVVAIHEAVDGRSIMFHRGSEHVREQPAELIERVRTEGALCGMAFDGDGDRLVVVDSLGTVYEGDELLFVLARHFHGLGQLKHDTIVTNDLANRGLADSLAQFGIRTIHTPKGDKNLEAAMWQGGYTLGGEPGGNIIINDGHHTAADAIFAALVLAGALVGSTSATVLRGLARPLRRRPQWILSREIPESFGSRHMEALLERAGQVQKDLGDDCRVLCWKSSTEPGRMRIMVEGAYEHKVELVASCVQALSSAVDKLGSDLRL